MQETLKSTQFHKKKSLIDLGRAVVSEIVHSFPLLNAKSFLVGSMNRDLSELADINQQGALKTYYDNEQPIEGTSVTKLSLAVSAAHDSAENRYGLLTVHLKKENGIKVRQVAFYRQPTNINFDLGNDNSWQPKIPGMWEALDISQVGINEVGKTESYNLSAKAGRNTINQIIKAQRVLGNIRFEG